MKKRFTRIIGILLALCLLLGMLSCLSGLLIRKDDMKRYTPFFEVNDQLDILFFGTSHMVNGVFPMELYDAYGFTSYNLGIYSSLIPTIYWAMTNALDYTQPELVVVDCARISLEGKVSSISMLHSFFDAFPPSANKVRALADLLLDREDGKQEFLELLWPFAAFHERWTELSREDFLMSRTVEKGADPVVDVAIPIDPYRSSSKAPLGDDMPGVQYLKRIIEECQSRDVPLLLTYLPYPTYESQSAVANAIYDLAAEYGVPYLNFLDLDVVDFSTDCYDANSHLNPSGARKVTNYLGQYIKENYDVPDRREDPAFARWNEDLRAYRDGKFELIRQQTKLSTYLMLLRDDDISTLIVLDEGSAIYDDPLYLRLIGNLAHNEELPLLRQCAGTKEAYMLLVDNSSGQIREFAGPERPEQLDTGLGLLRFSGVSAFLGEEETLIYGLSEERETLDLRVFVFDNHGTADRQCSRAFYSSLNSDLR